MINISAQKLRRVLATAHSGTGFMTGARESTIGTPVLAVYPPGIAPENGGQSDDWRPYRLDGQGAPGYSPDGLVTMVAADPDVTRGVIQSVSWCGQTWPSSFNASLAVKNTCPGWIRSSQSVFSNRSITGPLNSAICNRILSDCSCSCSSSRPS